jgi:hypothetical protein
LLVSSLHRAVGSRFQTIPNSIHLR